MLGMDSEGNVTHTYSEDYQTQKLSGNSISISISDDDMANAWVLLEDGTMAINQSGDEYKIEIYYRRVNCCARSRATTSPCGGATRSWSGSRTSGGTGRGNGRALDDRIRSRSSTTSS